MYMNVNELFSGSKFFQYERRYVFFNDLTEGMFMGICLGWPMGFISGVKSNQFEVLPGA